jgi:polysaccharide export outer membrane protein
MAWKSLSRVAAAWLLIAVFGPVLRGQKIQHVASAESPALSAASDAPADHTGSSRYRITQSDVLDLKFPYVADFDQTVTVQPDGYVSLKSIGDVLAIGRTVPELHTALVERYAEVLRDPVLNIVLKDFEKPSFLVAGEVAHPGKFELRGATTLTQALVLAGGYTSAAKHSQVILFRQFQNEWLEVKQVDVKKMYATHDMSEDPVLRPGDTILVPKSLFAKIAPFIPRPSLGFYLNPIQP